MTNISTPLRYPGGKSVLTDFFKRFITANGIGPCVYAEPYCGGAGAAINLLLSGDAEQVLLNDANFALYAFWASLKNHGSDFLDLFDLTEVTLDEWHIQRNIFNDKNNRDILQKGFSTFFLNRCNRSGILSAGPIGGQTIGSQLAATDKIEARFNRIELRKKIKLIVDNSEKFEVFNLDAFKFLETIVAQHPYQNRVFVYLDPPYYDQGSSLYLNYYKHENHEDLAQFIKSTNIRFKWILSYDNVKPIRTLYDEMRCFTFNINYSAQQAKLGSELMVFSENSILPESNIIRKMDKNRIIELANLKPVLAEVI
jgi:DNA adenine methylase